MKIIRTYLKKYQKYLNNFLNKCLYFYENKTKIVSVVSPEFMNSLKARAFVVALKKNKYIEFCINY